MYKYSSIWNFNSLFRVVLIFSTHTILRTSKSIGNNTMKKSCSLLRWPCLLRDVLNRHVYCSKQTGSSSTKETITHHFFVSGIGWRKLSMQPKFVAQKMLLKQKQQTFVNGLLGFITLGIYTPLEAVIIIAHNNCMSCPSIWATLYTLLINILLGFLPVVFA